MPSKFTLRAVVFTALAFAGCAPPSIGTDDSQGAATREGAQNGGAKYAYPERGDAVVVEGDMLFHKDKFQSIAASSASGVRRWPNGVIPYDMDPALPDPGRVTKAAEDWLAKTGIRWIPRTNETDYVHIVSKTGCFSHVGMAGGMQELDIIWDPEKQTGCPLSAVEHEMGHAIGLAHEQSRSDRDDYITINWENVEEKWKYAFDKTNFQSIGRYDVLSIMQYDAYAFSKNGQPTIVAKDGTKLEYHKPISDKDAAGVKEYYARELQGDNNDTGGAKAVSLSWPKKSETATYSLDVQEGNDNWIAPCVDAGILQRSLSTTFTAYCPSANRGVSIDKMKAFRICWTENDDWGAASCETVPYGGETRLSIGRM